MSEKYLGDALIDEVHSYFACVAELFKGKPHRYTIIDLSGASRVMVKKVSGNCWLKKAGR